MRRRRLRNPLHAPLRAVVRRAALALACVALAAVAVARLPPLAAGEARTARNETRWYGWAERHPRLAAAVEAAPLAAAPGTRVLWVVPPGVDRRWFEVRARYRLPAAPPVAVVARGTPPPADGWELRVDVYGDGRVVASPAPGGLSTSGRP